MVSRCVSVVATVMFGFGSFAAKADAGLITFDQAISGVPAPDDPNDPFDNCVVYCGYTQTAGNEGVFGTQGFTFTALTSPGPDHGEGVVVDTTLVPTAPHNGTHFLLVGGIVQMARAGGGSFSLASFQSANADPSDATVGQFLRVAGNPSGGPIEVVVFDLHASSTFQTFVLPSTWTGLTSVRFSGRLTASDVGTTHITVLDNINVDAVPEPASLALMGTGMIGLLALAHRRRRD